MVRKSNTQNQLIERLTELFQDKLEEKELERKKKVLRQAAAIAQIMERVERRLSPVSKNSWPSHPIASVLG
jgi:ATP-dependent Clp protease ATP-binding subunit ClpA